MEEEFNFQSIFPLTFQVVLTKSPIIMVMTSFGQNHPPQISAGKWFEFHVGTSSHRGAKPINMARKPRSPKERGR